MGLRLKTQLTALFLFLFGFSFFCLAYFNLSMLSTAVHSRAVEQSRNLAAQVEDWLTREIPKSIGARDLDEVAMQNPSSLVHYLERLKDLNCLEVYSVHGHPPTRLFRYGQAQLEQAPHTRSMQRALEGERHYRLWEYSSSQDLKGRAIEDVSPFSSGRVQFEYYAPIFRLPEVEGGKPDRSDQAGVVHISLLLPNTPLRIRVAVIGNLVLGLVFIFTGFLSLNLWAQHAIKRPLDGLMRARERLGKGYGGSEVEDLLSANELVAVSNSLNRLSLDLSKYQDELEEKTRRLEQANDRYRQLNEGLEQQVEEKTRELREFFSLVTHDLRIPLAATQGYADLLTRGKSGELNDKQRKFVKSIRTANSHALELVRNLLDAMRYEAGQNQPVIERFDFHELVQEVVSHLDIPDDDSPDGPIEVEIPDFVEVSADRTRIGRVLGNLVSNALRHISPGQQVKLTARVEGPNLRVEVADNGPGIPAENLPLLFSKFTHFPSERGPSSGLGLGLYIVRRILESHGEAIHVESRVGEGSRFWFHLPVHEENQS
ncbi:MAG: hypothetical protein AMXMBFR33_36210 [Candidatus Xenobia bacterium]|jgi:signal transduction histidine kinase